MTARNKSIILTPCHAYPIGLKNRLGIQTTAFYSFVRYPA